MLHHGSGDPSAQERRRSVVPVASHPIRDVGSRAPRARPAAPASAGPPVSQSFPSPRTFPKSRIPRNLPRPRFVLTLPSPQRHRRQLGRPLATCPKAVSPCRGSEGDSARRGREDGRGPWGTRSGSHKLE
ncbi:hypothetical protein HPB47_017969 [Ixodes persulcatus]|uniref:Uncharacterized protein n=1 Tax=Ixodes persulcatus TaxID=34615 RepID=A0AC60QLY1_IXOPE|nr:hypothetical protein HPB47_017969 [Ixodes persulcatus]